MPYFSFHELQLITVLHLIWDSDMSWSTRLVSLKLYVEFFIFDSVSFLLNFQFFFNKMHRLFDFKTSQFISKLKNRKATQSFASRTLIFKLQQDDLKFNDICVNWSSPKTDLVTNFLNPENGNFEKVSTVTFK